MSVTLTKMGMEIIKNFIRNIYACIGGIYYKRSRRVWLFGSWMGEKFTDNSRFLFQYLSENKSKYGIENVIWITKSKEVLNEIRNMGYEAYLAGTKESRIAHLRSGVHLICNSIPRDIESEYSAGAVKIQLWHGVGVKACGRLNRETKTKDSYFRLFFDRYIWPLYDKGNWGKAYFTATSEENKRVAMCDYGFKEDKIIITSNPRLCKCIKYKASEISLIRDLENLREKGKKIALYLPTFRDNGDSYATPFDIEGFDDFLVNNNIIWMYKQHSADKSENHIKKNDHYYLLDKDLDINVIYDFVDLVVTDYSSASSDAIFKNIRTLEYCPDISCYHKASKRRFVNDFSLYHAEEIVDNPSILLKTIYDRLYNAPNDEVKEKYITTRKFLFGECVADYEHIMSDIIRYTKMKMR